MFPPVITRSCHEEYFDELPFKQMGNLRMLIELPPARIIYKLLNNLLVVTHDGRLLMANNSIPRGRYIKTDVVAIKRVVNRAPFCVKDMKGRIHFIDMFKLVEEMPIDRRIFKCSTLDVYEEERKYPYLTTQIWESVKSQGIEPSTHDRKIIEMNKKLCGIINR